MERVLVFDGETGAKHFSNCYQALVMSPHLKANQERDYETKRLERNIHRAMKQCSEIVPADQPESRYAPFDIPARRLIGNDVTLALSQPEHSLLKKWVEQFPWGGGQAVEDGVETAEWLDAASKR